MINVWNNLPAEVNFSTIINTYKRSIHCVDFSSFLRRYPLQFYVLSDFMYNVVLLGFAFVLCLFATAVVSASLPD